MRARHLRQPARRLLEAADQRLRAEGQGVAAGEVLDLLRELLAGRPAPLLGRYGHGRDVDHSRRQRIGDRRDVDGLGHDREAATERRGEVDGAQQAVRWGRIGVGQERQEEVEAHRGGPCSVLACGRVGGGCTGEARGVLGVPAGDGRDREGAEAEGRQQQGQQPAHEGNEPEEHGGHSRDYERH